MLNHDSQVTVTLLLAFVGFAGVLLSPVIGGWMKVMEVKNLGKTAIATRRYEYFQHQMNQLIDWRHQGALGNDVSGRLISLIISIDDAEMQAIAERKDISADLRAHLAIIRLGQLINEERQV
jgi:hypothetical protein